MDRALQSMSADSVILGVEGGIVVTFPLAVVAFLAVNPSIVIVALLLIPKGNMASLLRTEPNWDIAVLYATQLALQAHCR